MAQAVASKIGKTTMRKAAALIRATGSRTPNIDFGGMMLELICKGVVAACEIKLDMSVFDMPFALVVKKEK